MSDHDKFSTAGLNKLQTYLLTRSELGKRIWHWFDRICPLILSVVSSFALQFDPATEETMPICWTCFKDLWSGKKKLWAGGDHRMDSCLWRAIFVYVWTQPCQSICLVWMAADFSACLTAFPVCVSSFLPSMYPALPAYLVSPVSLPVSLPVYCSTCLSASLLFYLSLCLSCCQPTACLPTCQLACLLCLSHNSSGCRASSPGWL